MKTLIILLCVIIVFLGFACMILCGILGLLRDFKEIFKKDFNINDKRA